MSPVKPILVCMVWRGGDRLSRCLRSIEHAVGYFSRVVISVTSDPDSADVRIAEAAKRRNPAIEVICTGHEMPTMEHQSFWIDYLQRTGATRRDWVCWLAYDDELRVRGIDAITDAHGGWPLDDGVSYFGPWAMRGESPEALWDGDLAAALESWTSFPINGPTQLSVPQWVADQLEQPTYMQMSGSVNPFGAFVDLRAARPYKRGPMRIEMAIALAPQNREVREFSEPITIIYGRPDSDRASYGKTARREDLHLASRMLRYGVRTPRNLPKLTLTLLRTSWTSIAALFGLRSRAQEEWRVRGTSLP
ncbi:hypothetical protein OAV85_00730 [Candidatus Nanopelagicales bacterium]|nr:hypothetical protein [Candidatus Nanopelagicales bacterium]